MALLYLAGSIACTYAFVTWLRKISRRGPPLPPSPPADPILGHARVIPPTDQDMFFYELGKQYGDVVYLHVLGKPMIVLNSVQAAVDLLEKRSSNYSDRPDFPIFELMGWDPTVTFLHYGKQFHTQRKLLQQYLNKNECVSYHQFQTREARVLVQNLITNPEGRDGFLARFATAIVIRLVSGHQIVSDDDPYIQMAENVGYTASNSGPPGATAVDFFPFLQRFPSWFPGTFYANFARDHRAVVRQLHDYPYNAVKEQLAKGTAKPSFLASQLEALNDPDGKFSHKIEDILGAAGAMYIGGADTTASSMSIFFLAMVLHPEYQAKAQEEIDKVIGRDRLPELSDRGSLPFLECILQESLRWYQAAPTGVPHRSLEDDIYNGMFIPKGSTIIANIRGMTLDEQVYAEPLRFNPNRFLPQPEGNGESFPITTFGFGRRVCPGRYLADASLWIAVASLLATVTIKKVLDIDGREITPEVVFISGIASHPKPFRCDIRPRDKTAQSLLAQIVMSDTE
ncbi:cytochrome P450 [Collybia nuda]|uniref:Cytochrome P450 n=1 Tax=Collybia nuda TaxID=64659 RepID=A0A9P5Y8N8_9AGAR|nr:cytochrome P450 [Collybia nuda]